MRIVKGIDMAGPEVHLDTKQRERVRLCSNRLLA